MLDVALIGLGSDWGDQFRPALQSLQKRLRIRGVFAAVRTLAEQAATDFSSSPSSGIASLIARSNIRGVLILDPGICPLFPVDLASQFGKPVFLARSALELALSRQAFRDGLKLGDSLLMPSCEWRYHPATTRLRELLASRLGRPREIRISVSAPGETQPSAPVAPSNGTPQATEATPADGSQHKPAKIQLWELFDWCRFLLGTPVHSLQALPASGTDGRQAIHLEFLTPASGGSAPRASIECPVDPTGSGHFPSGSACKLEVITPQGRAILTGPNHITWETAADRASESLEKDRRAEEVMLDHFARRALGGLIPVPTREDVGLAHDLVAHAEESLRTRRPVLL